MHDAPAQPATRCEHGTTGHALFSRLTSHTASSELDDVIGDSGAQPPGRRHSVLPQRDAAFTATPAVIVVWHTAKSREHSEKPSQKPVLSVAKRSQVAPFQPFTTLLHVMSGHAATVTFTWHTSAAVASSETD